MNTYEQGSQKEKDKIFWMEQLRMNSDLSVERPSIFEEFESYGDVICDTETGLHALPRNPVIEDTILDGKHCDVYLIANDNPGKPDIFIHLGKEVTSEEFKMAELKRNSFNQFSTDNPLSDSMQIAAEQHDDSEEDTDDDR